VANGAYCTITYSRHGRYPSLREKLIHRLRRNGKYVHYAIWHQIGSEALRSTAFVPIITQDFVANGIALDRVKELIWIFDLKPEGISSDDMKNVYTFFKNLGVPDNNFRVVYSCVEDVDKLPYPAVCLPARMIDNGNWFTHLTNQNIHWDDVPMTHKMVCLMRRPSIARANLAKQLLDNFDIDDLIITFGTNGEYCDRAIMELIHPHNFPLIVDFPATDYISQHCLDHDLFYRAPVNLVVESSSQLDPNTWRSIFITEKTFKAFAWHQFPLWYAVPRLVQEVRRLGFDVFDDLYGGHTYDLEEDPYTRMLEVVKLSNHICNQDVLHLRHQHWQRLQKNAELVKKIHTDAITQHTNELHKLIYDKI